MGLTFQQRPIDDFDWMIKLLFFELSVSQVECWPVVPAQSAGIYIFKSCSMYVFKITAF